MLKHNNPLYNPIILQETHDGLCLKKLNKPEFEIQETENNNKFVLNNDHKLLNSKNPIKETKNNVEVILNNQHKALLTQIIDDSDGYYMTNILHSPAKKPVH